MTKQSRFKLYKTGKTWTYQNTNDFGKHQWGGEDGNPNPAHKQAKMTQWEGMSMSKFCFCPRGDTPGTSRYFDVIAAGCIPVVISDDITLPFREEIPYELFTIFIKEHQFERNPIKVLERIEKRKRNNSK